ncbi:MAG: DUF4878 domain-containing protein [bacterium]
MKEGAVISAAVVIVFGLTVLTGCSDAFEQVYQKYNAEVAEYDVEGMKAYTSSSMKGEITTPAEIEKMSGTRKKLSQQEMEWNKAQARKEYQVLKKDVQSDGRAYLYVKVEGSDAPYGKIGFVKEDGKWKVDSYNWRPSGF